MTGNPPRLVVKLALIFLYVFIGHRAISERVASLGPSLELIFYLGLLALLIACLVATALIRNGLIRTFWAVLLFALAAFVASVESVTGEDMHYDLFFILMQSRSSATDAISQFNGAIVSGILHALPLLPGVALSPKSLPWRGAPVLHAAPIAGSTLLAAILFIRGGDGSSGLPDALTAPAHTLLYAYEAAAFGAQGERLPVSLPPRRDPSQRDVVLIIDESVAATYLDIGHPDGVRSGLGDPRPGLSIHNFGYAAAITNCSIHANVTLRFGGTRDDYQRINATMPSIWAYANAAGLRTIYIDAHRTGGGLHSFMDFRERGEIDSFIQLEGVPVRDRDQEIASRLVGLLNDEVADFILVNKTGAHFPLNDKYPDAYMHYRPPLPRGRFAQLPEAALPFSVAVSNEGEIAEYWRRYRNAYRNTLLWNVGSFFDRLLSGSDLSRAVIIYTSDHGQNLTDRGNRQFSTHCNSDPSDEEGVVPLVLIESSGSPTPGLAENLPRNWNHSSHYNIFPTPLQLMGYDHVAVRAIYGRSLMEPTADSFTFNIRPNSHFGLRPVWRQIKVEGLAPVPPANDAGRPARSDRSRS